MSGGADRSPGRTHSGRQAALALTWLPLCVDTTVNAQGIEFSVEYDTLALCGSHEMLLPNTRGEFNVAGQNIWTGHRS